MQANSFGNLGVEFMTSWQQRLLYQRPKDNVAGIGLEKPGVTGYICLILS